MTYHQLNELISKHIERIQLLFRTSDMSPDEYLNRVAQLIETRTLLITRNREIVSR